jgi:hypothetical protein
MQNKKPEIDSVNVLLEECIMAFPVSSFVISLYKQYVSRGYLTKKQLLGLYDKASGIEGIAPGKLAAVEAIIKKMPTRFKSEKPAIKPLYEKNEEAAMLIRNILSKNPSHKRTLFLETKLRNNEPISQSEMKELKTFNDILERRKLN